MMRPRFEGDVRRYSEIAKEETAPKTERAPDAAAELATVLDWHVKRAAERQHTAPEVQLEIYRLQLEKQKVMLKLRERLALVDAGKRPEHEPGSRRVSYDAQKGVFEYADDKRVGRVATFGDMLADIDWDVHYDLGADAPRAMRKRYLVERAKRELMDALDAQIVKSELGSDLVDTNKRAAYEAIVADRESGEDKKRSGSVSERIVKGLLRKMSADDADMPFALREADVFQDVEQKIDFVIRLKERGRGVEVEADEHAKSVGIQFTINKDAEQHKRKQIEASKRRLQKEQAPIQDIALVLFPMKDAAALRKRWEDEGRRAGGPTGYLDRATAGKLFGELLKDFFPPETIAASWEKVKNRFAESPARA